MSTWFRVGFKVAPARGPGSKNWLGLRYPFRCSGEERLTLIFRRMQVRFRSGEIIELGDIFSAHTKIIPVSRIINITAYPAADPSKITTIRSPLFADNERSSPQLLRHLTQTIKMLIKSLLALAVVPAVIAAPTVPSGNPFEGKNFYANSKYALKLVETIKSFISEGDLLNAARTATVQRTGTFAWISSFADVSTLLSSLVILSVSNDNSRFRASHHTSAKLLFCRS